MNETQPTPPFPSPPAPVRPPSKALWALCWMCLAWASVVLFFGANVTTTESGDATPDWPSSFGGAWYMQLDTLPDRLRNELTHRYVVPLLGILTLGLVLWTFVQKAAPGARKLAAWALGLLIAQAVLGGIRVKEWQFSYSGEVSATAHAVLAEIFFCTLVGLLATLSPARARAPKLPLSADGVALLRRAGIVFVLLIVHIFLGAMGRHDLLPVEVHAMFALIVVPITVRLVLTLLGDVPRDLAYLRRPGHFLSVLLVAQVVLGIWSYLARGAIKAHPAPEFGTVLPVNLHMLFGAWTIGTVLLILIRTIDVYGLPTDERVAPLIEARESDHSSEDGAPETSGA